MYINVYIYVCVCVNVICYRHCMYIYSTHKLKEQKEIRLVFSLITKLLSKFENRERPTVFLCD